MIYVFVDDYHKIYGGEVMNKISLTDFINVVSKVGPSKAKAIATIKNRKPYSPATDFYKGIREAIVELIEFDHDKAFIDQAVENATQKRRGHYQEVANGFKKWMGRKKIEWFQPPKREYGSNKIVVNVNPEIGAEINGVPHLIKMYFKSDNLPKNHALVSTHLMESCLKSDCPDGTIITVLDVRRGKLIESKPSSGTIDVALRGELAYIASIWDEL